MQYRDIMLLKILVCSPTVMDHQPHARQIETEKKKKTAIDIIMIIATSSNIYTPLY